MSVLSSDTLVEHEANAHGDPEEASEETAETDASEALSSAADGTLTGKETSFDCKLSTCAELLAMEDNSKCFDCNAEAPLWVNISYCVLLCAPCANVHAEFGLLVKPLADNMLTTGDFALLAKTGNKVASNYWLATWDSFSDDVLNPQASKDARTKFIVEKYRGKWLYPAERTMLASQQHAFCSQPVLYGSSYASVADNNVDSLTAKAQQLTMNTAAVASGGSGTEHTNGNALVNGCGYNVKGDGYKSKEACASENECMDENGYVNGHANWDTNEHANDHASGHATGHANGYANGYANRHANEHSNGQTNYISANYLANGFANGHVYGYMSGANGQAYGHANSYTHGQLNEHTVNEYANRHAIGHADENAERNANTQAHEHAGSHTKPLAIQNEFVSGYINGQGNIPAQINIMAHMNGYMCPPHIPFHYGGGFPTGPMYMNPNIFPKEKGSVYSSRNDMAPYFVMNNPAAYTKRGRRHRQAH